MSGQETIERFNAELDAALAGVGLISASDPGALELSVRLAGADFSAQSKARAGLRARLLAKQAAMEAEAASGRTAKTAPAFRFSFAPSLRFALAAACLLLVLVPALRRPAAPPQPPAAPARPVASAVTGAPTAASPALPAAAAADEEDAPAAGIFRDLPVAVIPRSGRAEPAIALTNGFPIRSVKGTRTEAPAGVTITWETDDGAIVLEQRAVTPADIFEKRTL